MDVCRWFALCDHPAVGVIKHPILGLVPCCQRCAEKLDMTDRLLPLDQGKRESLEKSG
jgi:hypothetical protein